MNENSLADLQLALREQSVVRSHEDFRNRGCLDPIEIVRNARERRFRNSDVCSLGAAAGYAEDSIADFPDARIFANALHFTGELESRNVLRVAGRRGIATEALQDVRAIQSRRV